MPSAIIPTTVATGIRRPRIHGTPFIWSARTVIRVNVMPESDWPRSPKRPWLVGSRPSRKRPVSRAPPLTAPNRIGGQHVRTNTGGRHRPHAIPRRDTRPLGGMRTAEQKDSAPRLIRRRSRRSFSSCAKLGPGPYADRTRALIAIRWRAELRISEALVLTESDLDPKTGSVLVRVGKGREAQDGRDR